MANELVVYQPNSDDCYLCKLNDSPKKLIAIWPRSPEKRYLKSDKILGSLKIRFHMIMTLRELAIEYLILHETARLMSEALRMSEL